MSVLLSSGEGENTVWVVQEDNGNNFSHSLRLEGKNQIFYFTLTTKDIKGHWYIRYDIYLVLLPSCGFVIYRNLQQLN